MGLRADLDRDEKCHLHRDSIPGPINPYTVDIRATLFRPAGLYVERDKPYLKLYKSRTRLLEYFLILGSWLCASITISISNQLDVTLLSFLFRQLYMFRAFFANLRELIYCMGNRWL
jgi:hypothetical protein